MADEWGPWVEHDGSGFPTGLVGVTILVLGEMHTGRMKEEIGCVLDPHHPYLGAWDHRNFGRRVPGKNEAYGRILRYRVRKPRALLELIDMVESLPPPQPQRLPEIADAS